MFKQLWLWTGSFFKEEVQEVKEEPTGYATRHAKHRLEERHGIVLTEEMTTSMVSDIENEKAEFIQDTRENTQVWIVTYKKKRYRVIYNYIKHSLVTVYSSTKNKKRKPSKKKKERIPTGRAMKKHSYKVKRAAKKPYKRNKKVEYERVM